MKLIFNFQSGGVPCSMLNVQVLEDDLEDVLEKYFKEKVKVSF